jgi:cytochrome c biogenesis protein ResB
MAADRTTSGPGRGSARGWARSLGLVNPLRTVWWLFINVRFAIVLLVALTLVSLAGVLIAQVPANVRGDAVLEADWLAEKEGTYGFLTDPMDALGLFDIFHASWFGALLAVTVVSTGAYVVSRLPGVWSAIARPRKRVPDRYFDLAPHRLQIGGTVDVARLEAGLRGARYKVERWQEGPVTLLFADRFQFARLGSLLTHAAVIVFILAAVVSRVDAFSSGLFLAEGSTLPVFPVKNEKQMQVQLVDSYAEFAPDGQPLDYRADLAIYQGGEEVLRCSSTVNTPCSYDGYRFYQVAYFGFGAELAVRDTVTGNVIYRETLALAMRSPAARLRIADVEGTALVDRTVVLPDRLEINDEPYHAGLIRLDDGTALTLLLPEGADDGDELLVFDLGDSPETLRLVPGETVESGGLAFSYLRLERIPAGFVLDLPLPRSAEANGPLRLQMNNVIFGTDTTSEGTNVEAPSGAGEPELTIVGLTSQATTLAAGDSVLVDGYEYTFAGQREFSGIDVRRDRSDYLIWIGAAAIVLGLMITFWVPRRRLWAKITRGGASLAGQAAGQADYTSEMRRLAVQAGAELPEETEDDD